MSRSQKQEFFDEVCYLLGSIDPRHLDLREADQLSSQDVLGELECLYISVLCAVLCRNEILDVVGLLLIYAHCK